ncbi:MAG TPA: redoxin domain-containing protein [Armatimonadota bacterium]|nr:redoxin domain-containing protein [Armatimonadota bacterium]
MILALVPALSAGTLAAPPHAKLKPGRTDQIPAGRAPLFELKDPDGRPHSLVSYRGRRVALFFFCGCSWCADCAREWGSFQRGGVLKAASPGGQSSSKAHAPITVIVFTGGADAGRAFITAAGLDTHQTVLLLDPDLSVTVRSYHAEPCPRVLIIDSKGWIRYANRHPDDAPRTAPALAIISHALTALRASEKEQRLARGVNRRQGRTHRKDRP